MTFIFICANKKIKGKCCASYHAEDVFNYLQRMINSKRHLFINAGQVKVVKTSCLGQCAYGPNLFIVPGQHWYTYHSFEDIDTIITQHFILGNKAHQLINRGIINE